MVIKKIPNFVFFFLNLYIYIRHFKHIFTFTSKVGRIPNIANPKSFYEKMIWRKVFDRNPLFYIFSDKLKCREYIQAKNLDLKFSEILWVGKELDKSALDKANDDFIIKANQGSGYNLFPEDQAKGFEYLRSTTQTWIRKGYGKDNLEVSYSKADKLIFFERMICDSSKVTDFLVRACDGDVFMVACGQNVKFSSPKWAYFDPNGVRFSNFENRTHPLNANYFFPEDYVPPKTFFKAVELARNLSLGLDFIRCDFLTDGENLYAGEITVYTTSGLPSRGVDRSRDINDFLNNKWDLLKSYFFKDNHSGFMKLYRDHLENALLSQRDSTTRL